MTTPCQQEIILLVARRLSHFSFRFLVFANFIFFYWDGTKKLQKIRINSVLVRTCGEELKGTCEQIHTQCSIEEEPEEAKTGIAKQGVHVATQSWCNSPDDGVGGHTEAQ